MKKEKTLLIWALVLLLALSIVSFGIYEAEHQLHDGCVFNLCF